MKNPARIFSTCLVIVFCGAAAYGHSPHDIVTDVKCSPAFPQDNRLFALVRSNFLVSNDRGVTWSRKINGLDHKNLLMSFDFDNNGRTIFVTSLGDGVYRSEDGGETWHSANGGLKSLVIEEVAVSQEQSGLAFVADVVGGLYRTTNSGASWQKVEGGFAKVTAIEFIPDGAKTTIVGDHRGGLYRSQDGGNTWDEILRLPGSGGITAIAVSPAFDTDPVILVATTDGHVLRSHDGGERFDSTSLSTTRPQILSLAMSPEFEHDRSVFASASDEGVYFSSDGGKTWEGRGAGLTRDAQAPNLGWPDYSRLSVSPGFASDRTVFLAGFDGLFQSSDAGRSWQQTPTLSPMTIISLAASPSYTDDQTVVVTTWLWGAFLSEDGGYTWRAINKGLSEPYVRDEGLVRLFSVVFSPNYGTDKTLFTSTWYDFFKSTDGGARWRHIPSLEFQTQVKTRHGSNIAVSPRAEVDKTLFVGTKAGFILRSTDMGESLELVKSVENMIGAAVVSPSFATDKTVFIGNTRGVYCSRDAGRSWEYSLLIASPPDLDVPISPAHPEDAATELREHILTQWEKAYAIKIAVSPTYEKDQTLFAATAEGLRRSRDGGRSWHLLAGEGLDEHAYVETVAVSPYFGRDKTLVVSIRGQGHYRSVDGGDSFSEIGKDLKTNNVLLAHYVGMIPKFPSLVFSPTYASDRTLFGFSSTDLYRSVDGGTTWEPLPAPVVTTNTRTYAWLKHVIYYYQIESRAKKLIPLIFVITILIAATAYAVTLKRRKTSHQ